MRELFEFEAMFFAAMFVIAIVVAPIGLPVLLVWLTGNLGWWFLALTGGIIWPTAFYLVYRWCDE